MNITRKRIQPESLFVTLASSTNHEYFPGNSAQKFSTKLVEPIQYAQNLEIGLVELFYSPAQERAHNIFPEEKDKKISVLKRTESQFAVKKYPGKLDDFVKTCNRELKEKNIDISFSILATSGGLKFVMKQSVQNVFVVINSEYAQALGFTKTYPPGRHEAEEYYSQDKFDKIDITHNMTITMYHDEEHTVYVAEPEERDVSHLISEINKSLTEFRITVLYADGKFEFENKYAIGARVLFSDFIAKIFDIPIGHWFEKGEENLPSFENINLGTSSSFVNVVCNIATPQQHKGKLMPILKMFQKPNKSGEIVLLSSNPILYVPIPDLTTIDKLQIELLDEFLNPIECMEDSETSVVLHIKSRFF